MGGEIAQFKKPIFARSKKTIMKKIFALLISFSFALSSFAAPPDSTKTKKPAAAKDRILIGAGFANWLNIPSGINVKFAGSRGFDGAVLYDQPLGTSPISLAIGLGFSAQNVSTNAQFVKDSITGVTSLIALNDTTYIRNKLSTSYINVPFELRFRSKPDKAYRRWNVAAGFKFGLLVQSHFKYEDKTGKTKTYNIDNLNLLNYGPTFRIGYGQVSLYGYYALTSLFENKKGPWISPFNFGVVIAPF
jgi:hypothetical protein